MLNILEGFDLSSWNLRAPTASTSRSRPRSSPSRTCTIGSGILHIPSYRPRSCSPKTTLRGCAGRSPATPRRWSSDPGGDTTYLCAVDAEGNGCSFINSLYKGFGSGIVAEGTGVCLHNRGIRSAWNPATRTPSLQEAPDAHPHPRPRYRDGPSAVFGVMGAAMQPQGHAQVLVDSLDYGMDPQEAVEHPRHRHENGVLLIEGRVPEREIARLRDRGHRIEVREDFMIPAGGAQLIRILDNGVRACGSDPRKDGCALAQ